MSINIRFLGRCSSAISLENARGFVAVIPDIKCVSPKEGNLLRGRDPVETAKSLVRSGAPMLSVVTERERFGGSVELLRDIVRAVEVPVLRKDFITNEAQLLETKELGAAAVLLICATTDKNTLTILYKKAIELGIEPLVEVHTAEEMTFAGALGASLVGINNRNIITLERDNGGADRTIALASGKPADALLVSESGILSAADAKLAVSAGANAVLVGTALWMADDMSAMYKSLRVERSVFSCVRP
jgi:indole-3-glycerol phosphate synthase